MRTTLGLVCTLLLAWPSTAVGQDAREAIEESIQAIEAAYNAGDVAALASHYTDDAVFYPSGAEPLRGREAIRAYWQKQMEEGGGNTGELVVQEVHEVGDAAVVIGSYVITDPGGSTRNSGSGRTESS